MNSRLLNWKVWEGENGGGGGTSSTGGRGGTSPSAGTGTGPDGCTSICERLAACPDADSSCAGDCANAYAEAGRIGCLAEYRDIVDCVARQRDLCNLSGDVCTFELRAYVNCAGIEG